MSDNTAKDQMDIAELAATLKVCLFSHWILQLSLLWIWGLGFLLALGFVNHLFFFFFFGLRQDKFQLGVPRPDVLESLTPNVRKRVEALRELQVNFLAYTI